jgi:hypothetical protein
MQTVYEMLKKVNNKVTKSDKLEVLEEHDCRILRFVLQASYDNNVQSLLPDGEPPFTPVEESQRQTLHAIEEDFPKIFKNGPMHNEPLTKVELVFMNMLSKLKSEEAKLLILAKDKQVQSEFKRITKPVVQEFLETTVKIK